MLNSAIVIYEFFKFLINQYYSND